MSSEAPPHHTHHHTQAVSYYRQALAVMRERGNAYDEADILDHIAEAYLALHQYDLARDTWEQALTLYQRQQRLTDAQNVARHLSSDIPRPVASRAGLLRMSLPKTHPSSPRACGDVPPVPGLPQ